MIIIISWELEVQNEYHCMITANSITKGFEETKTKQFMCDFSHQRFM